MIRKQKTHKQFIEEMKQVNPNIEILGIYINANSKIKCRCLLDGFEWEAKCTHLLNKHGCPKCGGSLQLTHDDFIERMKNLNPNIVFLNLYINNKTIMKCKCKFDGFEWDYKASNLLHGKCKCPKCRNKINWNTEQLIKRVKEIDDSIEYVSGEYENNKTKLKYKCLKCGLIWDSATRHLLSNHSCPRCNFSTGEKTILSYLKKNNIVFETQKKFNDLYGSGNGHLSYDFFLPQQNLLIEYNGIQHYQPRDLFGGEIQFQIQKEHDNIKRNYASDNKYNLLEIPYWDFNNIESSLSNAITTLTN